MRVEPSAVDGVDSYERKNRIHQKLSVTGRKRTAVGEYLHICLSTVNYCPYTPVQDSSYSIRENSNTIGVSH